MLAGAEYSLLRNGGLKFEGHVLNAYQVELLQQKVQERLNIANRPNSNIEQPGKYARELRLGDVGGPFSFQSWPIA